MMLLTVGIVMASCAKTDVFEQNQANYGEQQKSEYKANFVAKYGQPAANQSWDFAATSTAAKTRAGEGFVFKDRDRVSIKNLEGLFGDFKIQ